MSDIMKMKNLKNKVHRDGFDLSRRVGFTSKVGELNVVDFVPCIPGDKHVFDLNSFTRTQPLQTATLGRLREYYDVFFVPYRLLWSPFNDWVLQGNHSNIAKSWNSAAGQTETCPFVTKLQQVPPENDVVLNDHPLLFNDEEDSKLLKHFNEYGRKWKIRLYSC